MKVYGKKPQMPKPMKNIYGTMKALYMLERLPPACPPKMTVPADIFFFHRTGSLPAMVTLSPVILKRPIQIGFDKIRRLGSGRNILKRWEGKVPT